VTEPHGQARVPAPPKSIRFVQLPVPAMAELLNGNLAEASAVADAGLTAHFVTDRARSLWRMRLDQLAADPSGARWIARAVIAEPGGFVVGYAGFHGPPDEAGMVEIGYSVDPAHRRQGFAKAMLNELLRWAAAEPTVSTVRASISPSNTASLATIAGSGFVLMGRQWDEVDGLELIFEVPAGTDR
jgi:[ribosomal protein S5]-alanine N-acetyltransferase